MLASAMRNDTPAFEQGGDALSTFTEAHPELAETARSLHEDGFAICEFDFSEDDLSGAADFCRDKVDTRLQDGWRKEGAVSRLAAHRPVLSMLSRLYGRQAIPFQTLNFDVGTEQNTHSDTIHFDSLPKRFMCGVWLALEDICEACGPLHYYPGSHRLPILSLDDVGGAMDYAEYERYVAELLKAEGLERRLATLKRGQAFVWSANLFHGGSPRLDRSKTRYSQVTHYYFEDCAYYTPLRHDFETGRPFVREPYDIARRKFVASDEALLPHRADWRYRLHSRLDLLVNRPPPV